jgi:DNA (cytosine-5)-methyltransferase 1
MGWQTAWFSEIEPYACQVLHKHWPRVPNHGDITQIQGKDVEQVDILCGGFPCQDISAAGKKAGISGQKSGLWREYARLIEELRPGYAIIENPAVLVRRGLSTVLNDLTRIGYAAEWTGISACAVGAPHARKRVFIVAYPNRDSQPISAFNAETCGLYPDAKYLRHWRSPRPRTLRMADGVPRGMDRLRCLGNAVVPQVAYRVLQAIQARESGLSHI